MTHSRRHFKAGFTLIELLVVISIISLLVAILLPALSKSQERAQAIQCQSALRQIRIACGTYETDNRDYLPVGGDFRGYPYFDDNNKSVFGGNTPNFRSFTPMELLLRKRYIFDYRSLRCPTNTFDVISNSTVCDAGENFSFSMNAFGLARFDSGVWDFGTDISAPPRRQPKKPAGDSKPWSMILYADGQTSAGPSTGVGASPNRMRTLQYWTMAAALGARGLADVDNSYIATVELTSNGYWHNNAPHAVMADGHVEAGRPAAGSMTGVTPYANSNAPFYPFPIIYSRAASGTYVGSYTYAAP
jgi:prepilin-type N-terminal cleavage/methylation domain-containing protein/prepilin-type processing-associated H-X9-DG protein